MRREGGGGKGGGRVVKSNLGDLVSLALDFPPSILGHLDPLFKITVFLSIHEMHFEMPKFVPLLS